MKKLSQKHIKEAPENVVSYCPAQAPKPDPAFASKPFEFFLRKLCKLEFEIRVETDPPSKEQMWVRVEGTVELDGRTQLMGWLDNVPLNAKGWRFGDCLAFDREEVIEVTA